VRKLDRATIAKRVSAILATTQLAPCADRYPAELSGGQQQRVSLARALIVEPETLLLDEPLSSLDANLREEMRFEVRRLHDAYGYTAIYVTHDQGEAMTTADRIAVMNAGRIEQIGTPQEVYDQPRSEFVARFLGGSNILRGKALDPTHISFAGVPLECSGSALSPGAEAAVAIRQHHIAITNHVSSPPAANAVQCTVVRNVFLGGSRDYVVEARDGTQLRVTARAEESFAPGARVWVTLPPDRCRALVS
jgi:iron(III) transport system ATP-binding protein